MERRGGVVPPVQRAHVVRYTEELVEDGRGGGGGGGRVGRCGRAGLVVLVIVIILITGDGTGLVVIAAVVLRDVKVLARVRYGDVRGYLPTGILEPLDVEDEDVGPPVDGNLLHALLTAGAAGAVGVVRGQEGLGGREGGQAVVDGAGSSAGGGGEEEEEDALAEGGGA